MVEMAIMPRLPSMRYMTSRAEHMSGIMVRNTNVPLNVIFLSRSINFFLSPPSHLYLVLYCDILQMMR